MICGTELIERLEKEIETLRGTIKCRIERIEHQGIGVARDEINALELKDGGCALVQEYGTPITITRRAKRRRLSRLKSETFNKGGQNEGSL